jgi:predicted TIM-barrel fold metal-dependent hydrolase
MSGAVPGMSKRFDGRHEKILDPELPIIDAHHHLYDRPGLRYMFEDYLEDVTAGHNIIASVYVETNSMARAGGPEVLRPLGEIEFANGVAAMSASGSYGSCRVASAIVGYADLSQGDGVAVLLDEAIARAPDRFRGIRMSTLESDNTEWLRYVIMQLKPRRGVMKSAEFRAGFRHLAPRHLTFDAAIFHTQLRDLSELAQEFANTTIVLGNMGMALALDLDDDSRAEVFQEWRRELLHLSRRPNVACKIGGLGLPFWGFGLQDRAEALSFADLAAVWRPYVETAIEVFGISRCLMGSDFPSDGRSCGFVPAWNALKKITEGYSSDEKLSLFRDNAARIYRIDLPDVIGVDEAL